MKQIRKNLKPFSIQKLFRLIINFNDFKSILFCFKCVLFFIGFSLISPKSVLSQVPAFFEAQGAGAGSVGGRGGRIIYVTNLEDKGEGSLRDAVSQSGPRIVVFKVGGVIKLIRPLEFKEPYLTIAGQTAPGGGIFLSNNFLSFHWNVHDIVIRYVTSRLGKDAGYTGQGGDAVSIGDGAHNLIFDHCSFGWSNDETIGIWSDSDPVYNITFSNCIIAEALNYDHVGSGFIVGSNVISDQIKGISIFRNAFISNYNRNPLLKCHDGQVINNIIYNADKYTTMIAGGIEVDIVGNLYKKGPDSDVGRFAVLHRVYDGTSNTGPSGNPSVYLEDNIGQKGETEWAELIEENDLWSFVNGKQTSLNEDFRRHTPTELPYYNSFPITILPVGRLEETILPQVGASHKLSAEGKFVKNRNSVDCRYIYEYQTGTGQNLDSDADVGGIPTIVSGTPYEDSDMDGMSDIWEDLNGLDKTDDSDQNLDPDFDGFTNVEEFLNGTSILSVPNPNQTFQAENALLTNVNIQNDYIGFTGNGYVSFESTTEGNIEWSLNGVGAKKTTVTLRYSNDSDKIIKGVVTLNSSGKSYPISFQVTGQATWGFVSVPVETLMIEDLIKLSVNEANSLNIDYMESIVAIESTVIEFDVKNQKFGNEQFKLEASSTNDMRPIYFASSNQNIVEVTDDIATIIGGGYATIEAFQLDENNELIGSSLSTFLIDKADQSISFEKFPSGITTATNDLKLNATSSSGLEVYFTSNDLKTATIDGINVTVKKVGDVLITANQNGNNNYNMAEPVVQTLTIEEVLSLIEYANDGLTIYPNPTNNWFSINENDQNDGQFFLVDIHGKLVKSFQYSSENQYSIDELSKGVYILIMCSSNSNIVSGKLIISD